MEKDKISAIPEGYVLFARQLTRAGITCERFKKLGQQIKNHNQLNISAIRKSLLEYEQMEKVQIKSARE